MILSALLAVLFLPSGPAVARERRTQLVLTGSGGVGLVTNTVPCLSTELPYPGYIGIRFEEGKALTTIRGGRFHIKIRALIDWTFAPFSNPSSPSFTATLQIDERFDVPVQDGSLTIPLTFTAVGVDGSQVAMSGVQTFALTHNIGVSGVSFGSADYVCAGPSTPDLLMPVGNASVAQNDSSTGCSFYPGVGYGFQISFDWTDAASAAGITGYDLLAQHLGSPLPIVEMFVTDSQFVYLGCGSYIADANLEGWHWRVRAVDSAGNVGAWTEFAEFRFDSCLVDGVPCGSD